MRKSLLVLSTCLLVIVNGYSQTSENPVTASVSGVFLDYNGPFTGNYTDVSQFSPGIAIGGHVYLSAPLNLSVNTSYVPQVKTAGDNNSGGVVATPSQIDVYSLLQFKLNNGRMLKEDAFIAPYFSAGLGLNSISSNTGMYIPVAFGMRFRLSKNLALNLESMYKQSLSSNDPHLAHSVGLVFSVPTSSSKEVASPSQPMAKKNRVIRPNVMDDTDGDGIPNIEDACPELMGLVQFGGCPRKISEPNENEVFASAAQNTNPIELSNTSESISEINLAREGMATQMADVQTSSPLEFEEQTEIATPSFEKEDLDYLALAFDKVYFELNSDELGGSSYSVLDEVAVILEKYPNSTLTVTGHTDNTGDDKDNLVLSIKRAFKVKYYLVHEKGIKLSRINSNGFGDQAPVSDNSTESGRQDNRRVEFDLK